MTEVTIKLGQKVRDKLTGLEGTAIAATDWLYGCRRITIQPFGVHDGKPLDCYVIDQPQCEVIEDTPAVVAEPRHGARTDAGRAADAGRRS